MIYLYCLFFTNRIDTRLIDVRLVDARLKIDYLFNKYIPNYTKLLQLAI